MKKLNTLFTLLLVCAIFLAAYAQTGRYQQEVFTSVKVTSNVQYGVNATVLLVGQFGEAVPQPLVCDIYEPVGDTRTDRPLLLLFHTGNFIPNPQNGGTTGTKTDSSLVYLAHKYARMGYVVASVAYRLGWNPLAPTQDERVYGIINAAYRGVQDLRTAIRFFRRDVATNNNKWGIDPAKIICWGDGTGGYITLAAATLNHYNEILIPKFIVQVGGQPVPMVVEAINGDIYGTSVGRWPAGLPPILPAGDTLCYPNHIGYTSDFKLAVNMGGALGDSSWISAGDPPLVSFHAPYDLFAPYKQGVVLVPVVNLPVVEVQGSYLAQWKYNKLNLNAAWAGKGYKGDFSAVANSRNDGLHGLFPLLGVSVTDSSPWQWWDPSHPNHASSIQTNPNMSGAKGRSYLDTMIAYVTPRACISLNLGCNLTNANELQPTDVGMTMSPNPASSELKIQTASEYPMESVYVYDMSGRLVKAHTSINSTEFLMQRNSLLSGTYIVRVNLKQGAVTQKLMFN